MKRTGVEEYSIVELLDDHIAKLLMKSDGVSRCALQLELTVSPGLCSPERW